MDSKQTLADIESDIDYCRKKIRSLKYSAIPIQEKSKKIQIYNEMLADLTCRKKMIEESEKKFSRKPFVNADKLKQNNKSERNELNYASKNKQL